MRVLFSIVFSVIICHSPQSAHAEPLPRWEIGIGPAGASLPDYRGSDEQRGYIFPLPYFKYRGERVEIDREGIRGLFRTDRTQLGLSLAGAPAVDSDDNDARIGMPDLDAVVELGPVLEITLWRHQQDDQKLSLMLPLRGVVSVDGSNFDSIGAVFAPALKFESMGGRARNWHLVTSLGPLYADKHYHDYYYEVEPRFARPGRPPFDASAGYSGIRLTLTAARRFPKFWLGAFARYDELSGAKFEDSPLVERDYAVIAGVGIAWIVAKSRHTSAQR